MAQPNIDYYDHPVFHQRRLFLKTPAMKKLQEDIQRWLWTGATGGLITGTSRVGKTTALVSMISELYTRGKVRIPVYYISIPPRDQHTMMSVFRLICFTHNLRVTNHDRADHLSDRIVHYILDKSVEENCEYAVLFVDEMQRLWPSQFNPFAELYDKLSLLDISLTTIFVGNDVESEKLLMKVEKPEYAHIHGRFFNQGASFLGLTTKKEVHDCLKQYDQLRYPENGPSYTAYFLPKEVANGWQLTNLTDDIWRIYHEYKKTYKIKSWGMKYFTATINTLLTDYLPCHGVEKIDDDMIHECIKISGLISSLVKLDS